MREVATAYIRAVETPNSRGRYILSDRKMYSFVEFARILRPLTHSSRIPKYTLPSSLVRLYRPLFGLSQKWLSLNLGIKFAIDNTASLDDLKIDYRPLEESLEDYYRS